MQKLSFIAFALCGLIACDRATAPNRSLTTTAPRFGDFIIQAEQYRFPDTVKAGETIDVPFSVGDGREQCSYTTHITTWNARVIYFVPWGANETPALCRTPVFHLVAPYAGWKPNPDTAVTRADTLSYPVVYRVIVCQPDGSFRRSDVLVDFGAPAKQKNAPPAQSDSIRKMDERHCRGWAQSASR